MQEWIIAMLVISVLLVLRDMAKVFFRGRSFLKAEQPAEEKNPQKEKVERYAASFRKLADSFYGLPYRKDYLSNGQVDGIIRETCDEICSHCYQREICWGTQSQEMYRGSERMIRSMEEGNQEKIQETKSDWMSVCSRFSQYYETLGNSYMRRGVVLHDMVHLLVEVLEHGRKPLGRHGLRILVVLQQPALVDHPRRNVQRSPRPPRIAILRSHFSQVKAASAR